VGLVFDAPAFAEASDFACASVFATATPDRPLDKSADKRYVMADFMLNSDTPRLVSERF
jgi:hypothetical protein